MRRGAARAPCHRSRSVERTLRRRQPCHNRDYLHRHCTLWAVNVPLIVAARWMNPQVRPR